MIGTLKRELFCVRYNMLWVFTVVQSTTLSSSKSSRKVNPYQEEESFQQLVQCLTPSDWLLRSFWWASAFYKNYAMTVLAQITKLLTT